MLYVCSPHTDGCAWQVAYFQDKPQLLGWEVRSSFLHFHRRPGAAPPLPLAHPAAAASEGGAGGLDQLVRQVRTVWDFTSSSNKYRWVGG
jgi:hypothetical protein